MMLGKIKSTVADTLEHPKYGLSKIYWKTVGVAHCLPFKYSLGTQYDKIHDDLMQEDKFLLIVLDACRYDYFLEEAKLFFEDHSDIEAVYSSGRNTFEYSRNTWNGDFNDVKYVSGATPVNSKISKEKAEKSPLFQSFVPGNHLDIEDVWLSGWNDDLGTVPSNKVKKETINQIRNSEKKVVSHFFQPHAPYIGVDSLIGYKGEKFGKNRGNAPDEYLWKRFFHGEISDIELRKAYRSNLKYVLEDVVELIDSVDDDRRIVITGDHGELLGESGLQEHKLTNHPLLRKVPWMEVER